MNEISRTTLEEAVDDNVSGLTQRWISSFDVEIQFPSVSSAERIVHVVRSFVCSVAFPVQRRLVVNHVTHSFLSSLFLNDRANGQQNTVIQGKCIAATSWLCVLLDNTTVDNVYIYLDISQFVRAKVLFLRTDSFANETKIKGIFRRKFNQSAVRNARSQAVTHSC